VSPKAFKNQQIPKTSSKAKKKNPKPKPLKDLATHSKNSTTF
jgi:hypothetical protein